MRKISIINNKGGVGKTTTAFNLVYYFSKAGYKTLAIDMDPQQNMVRNFGISDYKTTIGDYLLERVSDYDPVIINDYLHLIPAGNAENDMQMLISESPLYFELLDDFLKQLDEVYDIVVVDTAPAFNAYTTSAIYATNIYSILIPGQNEINGLNTTIDFSKKLKKKISGIILARMEKTALSEKVKKDLNQEFGDLLLDSTIRKNVMLSESILEHKSIFDYAPNSNGANDYIELGKEILKKEGVI